MKTRALLAFLFLIVLSLAAIPLQTSYAFSNPDENSDCLLCHSNPGFTATIGIQQKVTVNMYVDPQVYAGSIHNEIGLGCVGCHVGFKAENGHAKNYNSLREAALDMTKVCGECHEDRADEVLDSVHSTQLASGNVEAAVCSDCHSPHEITRIKDPVNGTTFSSVHFSIAKTCEKCHSEIYEKYAESVHGQAAEAERNPDVPTCTTCHGVHNMEDPRTAAFRLKSPTICGSCHSNPDLMGKYGISTDVLKTYVADFHGTTVSIFEQTSPDAETNKPVCYDCHGIHDIAKTDDPDKGLKIKQNLLVTCQKCHPDATANFPDSWTSHYIPNETTYPIVYYIDLFYKFFIPAVLVPMGLLVILDLGRSVSDKLSKPKRKKETQKPGPSQIDDAPEEIPHG